MNSAAPTATATPPVAPAVSDDDKYEGMLPAEVDGLKELDEDEAATAPDALKFPEPAVPDDDPDKAKETPTDDEPAPTSEPAAEDEPSPLPPIDFSARITGAKTSISEADEKLRELQDQWDNGDISEDDYRAQTTEWQDKRLDAETDLTSLKTLDNAQKATLDQQAQARQEDADKLWNKAQAAFIERNPAIVRDATHLPGFNRFLSEYTKPDGLYADWSYPEVIDKAAEDYIASVKRSGGTPPEFTPHSAPQTPNAEDDAKTASEREEKGKQMQAPPVTLKDVPNEAPNPHQTQAAQYAAMIENETDPDRLDEIMARIPEKILDTVLQYGSDT